MKTKFKLMKKFDDLVIRPDERYNIILAQINIEDTLYYITSTLICYNNKEVIPCSLEIRSRTLATSFGYFNPPLDLKEKFSFKIYLFGNEYTLYTKDGRGIYLKDSMGTEDILIMTTFDLNMIYHSKKKMAKLLKKELYEIRT